MRQVFQRIRRLRGAPARRLRAAWPLALAAGLLVAGCGRNHTATGRVVVVDGEPSSITEIVGGPVPVRGTPVAHATVTMFHELDGDRPVRASRDVAIVFTDADGRFRIVSVASAGTTSRVGLEVRAPGHDTAYLAYIDYAEPDEQVFLVVLRRSGAADPR